jgi:hypothetical protein
MPAPSRANECIENCIVEKEKKKLTAEDAERKKEKERSEGEEFGDQ